jgi:hypothetical protein
MEIVARKRFAEQADYNRILLSAAEKRRTTMAYHNKALLTAAERRIAMRANLRGIPKRN